MKIEITLEGFEAYLQEVHQEEYPELLDDDLPDAFIDWIATAEGDDLVEYAKHYFRDMNWAEELAEAYFTRNFGK